MRDPKRIPEILKKLGELWEQVPDWRLGQLFCNLQRHEGVDLFFYEDDKLLRAIEEFLNPEAKKNQEINNGVKESEETPVQTQI